MSGNVKQNSKPGAITNVLNHVPNTVKKLYNGIRYSLSEPVIFVDSDGYTKKDMFDGTYVNSPNDLLINCFEFIFINCSS